MMRHNNTSRIALLLSIIFAISTITGFSVSASAAETTEESNEEVTYEYVYQMYNPNPVKSKHVYLTDTDEVQRLIKYGWEYLGIAFESPSRGTPVYRVYNPNSGEHFYLTNESEKDDLASVGWVDEGVFFNAVSDGVPVYRLYCPATGVHHFTMKEWEKNLLSTCGYIYEGIAFNVAYGINPDIDAGDIEMEYDDEIEIPFPGKEGKVLNSSPTSYVVKNGKATGTRDSDVVRFEKDYLYASGVGTSEIAVNDGMYSYHYNVTVKPAKLTIMYLTGQSNMQGFCSGNGSVPCYQTPENSVLLERGKAYSIYNREINYVFALAPSFTNGYTPGHKEWDKDIDKYMPGSLARDNEESVSGNTIGKRSEKNGNMLDDFTEYGTGKCGPDSALCYEWNQLTGEKILCVNAAVGGMKIDAFSDDELGLNTFIEAKKLYEAEISSGHYTKGHSLAFIMQGESDIETNYYTYKNCFMTFYKKYKDKLGFEKLGVIMPRVGNDDPDVDGTWNSDIRLNDVRSALYDICKNESGIVLVSDENKLWVTDRNVEYYFKKYGGEFPYTLRPGNMIKRIPETLSDVHRDIHFSQVAHNENGLCAARGMYKCIKK